MAKTSSSRTVLIIADPEGQRQVALNRGFHLARSLGCTAHVVGFCHESLAAVASTNKRLAQRAQTGIMRRRKDSLSDQIKQAKIAGLKVTSEVVWSKRIHEWIEKACRAQPPEVVVKTGHRSETFVYTPTDWHLIRECAAPALIVSEKKWRKTKPVLAAVDLSTRSRSKQKLNRDVIETAKSYAEALDCPLYLLHVLHISAVLTELDLIDEHSHTRGIMKTLEPKVRKLCREYDIPEDRFLLKRGPVHKVIISESARVKAQLLVLGTVGRRGAGAKLIGNTAEKVLMLAHTDVLALKP